MTSDLVTLESLGLNSADMSATIDHLTQFRKQLYDTFDYRSDAMMSLLDALCSNTTAHSIVQLSLNPRFNHSYNSVYDAIQSFFMPNDMTTAKAERESQEQRFIRLISDYLPDDRDDSFVLFSVDVTPAPRRFARRLEDRSYVYQPNTIASNKPVTIGHQYSALVLHPQKAQPFSPPWVVPLSIRRVKTDETKQTVAAQQVQAVMNDTTRPFQRQLSVQVNDSHYSSVAYLGKMTQYDNLITIVRARCNRTFYRKPPVSPVMAKRGHPKWYGERFDLTDQSTWGEPDEIIETTFTSRRGQTYTVCLDGWSSLLMTGTRDYPMHQHPFTLVRVRMFNQDNKLVYDRPLWLLVCGERREEITLIEVWSSYRQRYDVEHFFRFGKQRLLTTAYQTPEVIHEENWWQLTLLAYVQLWLGRQLTERIPQPWERYLPRYKAENDIEASPSEVQRDWLRIIQPIGTPANLPKPRGKSQGRAKGEKQKKRNKQPVIKKTTTKRKKAA